MYILSFCFLCPTAYVYRELQDILQNLGSTRQQVWWCTVQDSGMWQCVVGWAAPDVFNNAVTC